MLTFQLCVSSERRLVSVVILVSMFVRVRLRRPNEREVMQFTHPTAWG